MQVSETIFDVAIVGGGLAGLSLSIQLARKGFSVILFEKESYPFHKVCGEYISKEAWPFLESLGVPLSDLQLPVIDQLLLTAPDGTAFRTPLPLGGFGISRYILDDYLAVIARREKVVVKEASKVEDVEQEKDVFTLLYSNERTGKSYVKARFCAGSYGKRSNLDIKWKRAFIINTNKRLNNFIAVKYHVTGYIQPKQISLHNFVDGYCGISEVEQGTYCLCYLTTARNLQKAGNKIPNLEELVLKQNPFLKDILEQCVRKADFPITISQISFSAKTWEEGGVVMLGDATGMISPLCGNGMSMALHSSKMLAGLVEQYLTNSISRQELLVQYRKKWLAAFGSRMKMGRLLQRVFGHPLLTNLFVSALKAMPFLARPLIKSTHGRPF
jgi:flavin-dependent dehydrogenase